jgi:hypothetical protein
MRLATAAPSTSVSFGIMMLFAGRSSTGSTWATYVFSNFFSDNLIRSHGLFARGVMHAQAASLSFTPVFAAFVSAFNTSPDQRVHKDKGI